MPEKIIDLPSIRKVDVNPAAAQSAVVLKPHQSGPIPLSLPLNMPSAAIPKPAFVMNIKTVVLALVADFQSKRLNLALQKYDFKELLNTPYCNDQGIEFKLLDEIVKSPQKSQLFFKSIVDDNKLFMKIVPNLKIDSKPKKKANINTNSFTQSIERLKKMYADLSYLCFTQETIETKRKLVHIAAKYNKFDSLKVLNTFGADFNIFDASGEYPVSYAALNMNIEILDFFYVIGANFNLENDPRGTLAHRIISHNSLKMLQKFHDTYEVNFTRANDKGLTLAHIASNDRLSESLLLVCSYGVNINQRTLKGLTAANYAADDGEAVALQVLKQLGADLEIADEEGCTPAHRASQSGYAHIIRLLHEFNVDLNKASNDHKTPTHRAILDNHIEVVKALHESRADLNCKSKDILAPVFFATPDTHVDMLELLHSLGVDLNQVDDQTARKTIAHYAASEGQLETLRKLDDLGISLVELDAHGYKPIDYAIFKNHQKIVTFLQNVDSKQAPHLARSTVLPPSSGTNFKDRLRMNIFNSGHDQPTLSTEEEGKKISIKNEQGGIRP